VPPAPSLQAPQPTTAAWPLTVMEPANSARRSAAIKQSPWVLRLGRRVAVVVGHDRRLLPPRAAPARLAAWCIGRAPRHGDRKPTRSGARTGPGRSSASYLCSRNPVNTAQQAKSSARDTSLRGGATMERAAAPADGQRVQADVALSGSPHDPLAAQPVRAATYETLIADTDCGRLMTWVGGGSEGC
jgi:hypothetical protein